MRRLNSLRWRLLWIRRALRLRRAHRERASEHSKGKNWSHDLMLSAALERFQQ
jgi:hypothetical protein